MLSSVVRSRAVGMATRACLHLTLMETRLVRAREPPAHTMVKSGDGGVSMLSTMQVLNAFVRNWQRSRSEDEQNLALATALYKNVGGKGKKIKKVARLLLWYYRPPGL